MVYNYETIEEQVRNKITPIYNFATVLRKLQNPKTSEYERQILYDYLINEKELPNIFEENIEQLIQIANNVDKKLTNIK